MGRWIASRWTPSLAVHGGRRAKESFTFQAFLPEPLADRDLFFAGPTAADCSEAEAAVALADHGRHIVAMETLSRLLLRSESVASSRIEGLTCSQRRLAEAAFDPEHANETARRVLANIDAMRQAIELGLADRDLTVEDVRAMHWTLMRDDRDLRAHAGRFRTVQNWIGGRDDSPRDAAFVPPPPEHVESLMADLAAFMNRDDLPTLAQAAIVHAQFETIHPFVDGNGRVGRCLIHVVLGRRRLVRNLLVPVSLVLAAHGGHYIQGLVDFREGRVDDWCSMFAAAAKLATEGAARFEAQLAAMISRWRLESEARPGSYLWHACEATTRYPVFTIASLRDVIECSQNVAAEVVERLESVGIVTQVSLGKRNRVYLNRAVLRLLDDFERDLLTDDDGKPGRLRVSAHAKTALPIAALPSVAHAILELFPVGTDPLTSKALAAIAGHRLSLVRRTLLEFSVDGVVEPAQADRWSLTEKGRTLRAMLRSGEDLHIG